MDKIIILFSIGVGLSFALVMWLVARAVSAVPAEDREFKDRPPLGFRLFWWPIQWLSFFIDPFLGLQYKKKSFMRLRQAGLDYTLNGIQFLSSKIVSGFFVGVFFAFLLWLLNSNPDLMGVKFVSAWQVFIFGFLLGYIYPSIWLKDLLAKRKKEVMKALPFYLDIITLCVEAGLNLQGAINQAVSKGPKGVIRDEFQKVLRDIRAGTTRADSLRKMSERMREPSVNNLVSAIIQAESMGMNLGPVLRAQADQRRTDRFLKAEKLALEAPVKMLLPLIAFIFPCTFIVLFFPIVMKFMESGL